MGEPPMIHTDQVYYRWSDVRFWSQSLPEGSLERSMLAALFSQGSLESLQHPLVEKGKDGFSCSIATFADGRRALCFHLRQVQYMQYYVHQTCLAEAEYVSALYALKEAGKDLSLRPPQSSTSHIPLPNNPILATFATEVEDVIVKGRDLKKLGAQIKKANKRMDREERTIRVAEPLPAADQAGGEDDVVAEAGEDAEAEAGPSSPRSSASSTTVLANEVLSDDEEEENNEPQLTDPDALPRPAPVGQAELYYRAHVALESANMRSFLRYYLQGQEPNAALAKLPEWVGCGTFFSIVPNYHGEALTDVGLCTLSFPLVGEDVEPIRETKDFVVAEASRIPGIKLPEEFEPVRFEDLGDRINAAIDSAWEAGGGGARYFLRHPSESTDFSRLGVDTSSWHPEMQRAGIALAPWMDSGAWGETFEVDIARLLELIGKPAGIDLSAHAPTELCALFELEPRDAESASDRAELLVELAIALLESPLNVTYMKFLSRLAELQSSLESSSGATSTDAPTKASASESPPKGTDPARSEETGQNGTADRVRSKQKKKGKKGKKYKKPKPARRPSGENGATEASAAQEEDTTDTADTATDTATDGEGGEATEGEADSDGEPDFSGGVLLGRDGKLVSYVREV